MESVKLVAKKRDTSKNMAKKIRREGYVPGEFYTKGEDNIHIMVEPLALRPIVYTSQTRLIDLEVEGDSQVHNCVLKNIDLDPVTDELLHFDLLGIKPGQKLTVAVPFVIRGQAPGIQNGGVLNQTVHKAKVTTFPRFLPEAIEIDVSELDIGDAVYLRDIVTEDMEFEYSPDTLLAVVNKPRVATEDEVDLEEGETLEGEEAEETEGEEAAEE